MTDTDIQEQQNRSVLAFYAAGGLREIIPIYPLYSVMFIANGITPFELSLLFIIWATVGMLVEVPSGALADAFSRKWLIVSSGVLKSAAFLCWFFWQDFWGYALGFACWGIGSSLRSGAFEALLYETCQHIKNSKGFAFHYGRIRAIGTICVMLGEVSGGLLITFGFDLVLVISAIVPLVVSIPFILFVNDIKPVASEESRSFLAEGFREARNSPALLMILFVSTFLLTVHGIFDEYVPPLFQQHGFSLAMIAFLAVPAFAAQALGEYLADQVPEFSLPKLLFIIGVGTSFLFPAALYANWLSVVGITVFFFAFGLAGTLIETNLQETITGEARATVTSIIGLGDSVGAIVWFFLFGLAAEWHSISGATIGLALLTLLLCLATSRYRFNIKPTT